MTDYYRFVNLIPGSTIDTDLVVLVNITERVSGGSKLQGQVLVPSVFALSASTVVGSSYHSNLRAADEGDYHQRNILRIRICKMESSSHNWYVTNSLEYDGTAASAWSS